MTNEFAYLLGMILGNGEIVRDNQNTQINIDIPHKKLETDSCRDIDIYVKASLVDINRVLSRLASTNSSTTICAWMPACLPCLQTVSECS